MEAGAHPFTLNPGHVPALSAASIMAATSEAFPPAGGQALAAVSMEVVLMAVEDVADRRTGGRAEGEFKNGEEYHAAQDFDFCST